MASLSRAPFLDNATQGMGGQDATGRPNMTELLNQYLAEELIQFLKDTLGTGTSEAIHKQALEPEISYDRVFGVTKDNFSSGKKYLKEFHDSGSRDGLQQYLDLQSMIRGMFRNLEDLQVPLVLLVDYKHNEQGKVKCMEFIRKMIDSLCDCL